MANSKNQITVSHTMSNLSAAPLDSRTVIETKNDIERIQLPYIGMIFYIKDEDKLYKVTSLKDNDFMGITQSDVLIGTYESLVDYSIYNEDLSNFYYTVEEDSLIAELENKIKQLENKVLGIENDL